MTQDLKLDGGVTLKGDTTDLASDTATFELKADNSGTWCKTDDAECIDQSLMTKQDAPNGYFYNWHAATAGYGKYNTDTDAAANYSICPKGWKLPTGGANGQFVMLDKAYGGTGERLDGTPATVRIGMFMAAPLNFNYAGYRNGGSTYNATDNALYWSRTASSNKNAYDFRFYAVGVFYPQGNNSGKYYGFTLRCLAAT